MQLAGVFDDDDAVSRLRDLGQQGVDQGGLAGAGSAGDEDVGARCDRLPEDDGLVGRHNARGDIVVEHKDGHGDRCRYDRR